MGGGGMHHLLRLGPVPLSEGAVSVYLRIADSGDFASPVFAPEGEAGLQAALAELLAGLAREATLPPPALP